MGILAEPRLVARTISLRAGDTLILSSDGLTEAYRDRPLRGRGAPRLRPGVGAAPVVEALAGLLTTFDDVDDDVAVVALTVKG
jgi:sigma-B regulation protein RsbU (phosphoserine phosphatase)